ncbi:uncharacterized protein LOC110460703 [Mizuhopecten yessoensis]|uniref:uncharacterized protein LOC110460703 n=1 Tax=Mizuhopecten yessoensis TaxID=6573 RepID=UPI000B457F6D|nr:uncharacterized protein LOC110460703 [Mizuhopecten yessoensis]
MRVLITALLVCIALALCQAAVKRAFPCTIALDCKASVDTCEDTTHHWSCLHHLCACQSHGSTSAPNARPHEGSPCSDKDECRMDNCPHDNEHCYDGACKCTHISDEHHHG